MINDFEKTEAYNKIFTFHLSIPERLVSRESTWLEFKESFDWRARDEYAKILASFANNKGGFIVFGVKNQPRELVGLKTDNFETTDEAKICAYLNSTLSPEIEFDKFVVKVQSKNVGILHVLSVKNKPVVSIKNDGQIKEAEIYYRYNASSEKIKYPEMSAMIEHIRETERISWKEVLGKVVELGSASAAVLDIKTGQINGGTGTLIIEDKLIPKLKFINEGTFRENGKPVLKLIGNVKPISVITDMKGNVVDQQISLTDDPNAPAMRLMDDKVQELYPWDYNTLTKALLDRYSDFKINQKYHNLRKSLINDKKYSFRRLLNPQNPKSSHQDFYSKSILSVFDSKYKKRTRR